MDGTVAIHDKEVGEETGADKSMPIWQQFRPPADISGRHFVLKKVRAGHLIIVIQLHLALNKDVPETSLFWVKTGRM